MLLRCAKQLSLCGERSEITPMAAFMNRGHWARWAAACTLALALSEFLGFAAAHAALYERDGAL